MDSSGRNVARPSQYGEDSKQSSLPTRSEINFPLIHYATLRHHQSLMRRLKLV